MCQNSLCPIAHENDLRSNKVLIIRYIQTLSHTTLCILLSEHSYGEAMDYRQFNRNYRPKKGPRITRRGIKVSPKFHIGKIIVYMIITPLITWYAHQKYTNPFSFYPNIAIDYTESEPAILFYETSFKDTTHRIRCTFEPIQAKTSAEKAVLLSANTFQDSLNYFKGSVSDSTTTILYGHKRILVPFGSIPDHAPLYPTDILIIPKKSIEFAKSWRNYASPRLTIIFDTTVRTLPSNFATITPGILREIVDGRFKTLKLK